MRHIFDLLIYIATCFYREYVVDLIGDPGSVHGPDASINGGVLSSLPSPFKMSYVKEFPQRCIDNVFTQLPQEKDAVAEMPYSGNIVIQKHLIKKLFRF